MATTHNWKIAEREYQRHEERRGRRFAYGHCDPTRTCLVIVDMVNFFVQQSASAASIVGTINEGASALRQAGGTVAWVVPTSTEPSPWQQGFYGTEIAERYAASGGSGAPPDRVAPELSIYKNDIVVEKSTSSAFHTSGCDLHALLQAVGIERVLIAGTVTSVCCESSARDAATLGYEVVFVGDATADVSDEAHNATLRTIYRSFGDVRSMHDALALVDD